MSDSHSVFNKALQSGIQRKNLSRESRSCLIDFIRVSWISLLKESAAGFSDLANC